ncbi:MAG TPA: hypothetical protein VIB08_01520 [Thermoanaerobaculia bacterium]|jgi:hypothetical protein
MNRDHTHPRNTLRRRALASLVALGAVALVAGCGGSSSSAKQDTTTEASQTTAQTTTGPRSFDYVNNGLEATLDIDGATGTLTITNGREAQVGKPALYALDGLTGKRTDAALDGAAPIPAGGTARLAFRFPEGTNTAAAGFFGLEFGGADAGGFDGP